MKLTPAALSTVLIPLFIALDVIVIILIIYAVRSRRVSARRERPDPAAMERYLRDPDLCSLSYAIHMLDLRGLAQDQRAAAVVRVLQAGADALFIGQASTRFGRPITQAVVFRARFVCSNCCPALSFDRPLGQVGPYCLSARKTAQDAYTLAMGDKPGIRLAAIGCRKDLTANLAAELQYSCGEGLVLLNVESCTQGQAQQLAAFFNNL